MNSFRFWRISFLFALAAVTSPALTAAEPVLDESNSWAFTPPRDIFAGEAALDLRFLNEAQSGENGFVRLSDDGNSFVRGNGEPIRFWAIGTDAYEFSPEEIWTVTRAGWQNSASIWCAFT